MRFPKTILLWTAMSVAIPLAGARGEAPSPTNMVESVGVRSSVILSNGRKLSYLHWANPSRPAILLLHGKAGFATSFIDFAQRYSDRFDIYAVDMRGRGFSDWAPDLDYTVESTERDIFDFIQAVGLRRFGLYGHSFGAVMSLNFAAHHPDKVAFLIMEDAGPIALPDGSQPVLNEGQTAPAGAPTPAPSPRVFGSWEEATKTCVTYCTPSQHESLFVRRFDGTVAERSDIYGLWASKRGEGFTDQWPLIRQIRVPSLYLRAQYGLMPLQIAQEVVCMNGRFTLVSIAGARHSMRWSAPEPTYAAITTFLDRRDVLDSLAQ